MGKKHRNLYSQIYDWENLLFAYKQARRGKSYSSSFLLFKEYHLRNLRILQEELTQGTWKPDTQLQFEISDPKKRIISCQSFRDRVVHHALIQVIGSILDEALMPQVFACRVGLGNHRCVKRLQQLMRRNPQGWILHVDFSKFFPTMPQDLVLLHIGKKITCQKTLELIKNILSVQDFGVPIGALTSQIFSNFWGGKLDRFVAGESSGDFVRYMDDMAIVVKSRQEGKRLKEKIDKFVSEEMKQKIGKWGIFPVKQGVTFCGFRIRTRFKLIKKQSMVRQRRRLTGLLNRKDYDGWKNSQLAWLGHLRHADGQNALANMGLGVNG